MTQNISKTLNIQFEIPDFQAFGELLHDRLHAVLYHIEDWETKFMLITNLFDRDPVSLEQLRREDKDDIEGLKYIGTQNQRKILEKHLPAYYIARQGTQWDRQVWQAARDTNWQALWNRRLDRSFEGVETFAYFEQFRNGLLDLYDIQVSRLKDYFNPINNVLKKNEYPIISDYFDIEEDLYIGIPLLGLGLFQGIVWIVFKKEEAVRLQSAATVKRLIKLFQMEYDNLAFDWELKSKELDRTSLIRDNMKRVSPSNQIQEDCNIVKYYEISSNYIDERVRLNDAVANRIRAQYQKTAIITILLDSYAHNISAHSLTALSWWFRDRAEYFEEGKELIQAFGRDQNPLIRYANATHNSHLSRELWPLFKFLLEKGAFWSGITRQTNFAGKVSSLYSVLWYDFINNPLYLGTIANTESVKKVHLRITIYESEEKETGNPFNNRKKIKRSAEGRLLDGIFATVNLDDFSEDPQTGKHSLFVEEGELFLFLKPELEKLKAFFPGGVAGKHAFFTLLENEIRNVKHYKDEALKTIQKDGLVLNISIHDRPVDSNKPKENWNMALLKIGVWLGHPNNINAETFLKRISGLDSDILTEDTYQPRLGGNYQDKICASMLLTNTFDNVQDKSSPLGKIYYPWLKTATHKLDNNQADPGISKEFEVSHRQYQKVKEDEFKQHFLAEEGPGYLKKYFHLWVGADIMHIEEQESIPTESTLENYARYRLIHLAKKNEVYEYYKRQGLIRLIAGMPKPANLAEGYNHWLSAWIKPKGDNGDIVFDFIEGETLTGRLTFENGRARFENVEQIREADNDDALYEKYQAIPQRSRIVIAHGGKLSIEPDKFNYRSHGELISRFCKGVKPMYRVKQMDEADVAELIEALATRICIFDRRSYSRMYLGETESGAQPIDPAKVALQKARLDLYRRELFLDFQTEELDAWRAVQARGFLHYHFLVLHLSFVEGMKDAEGILYSEERILDFIDREVLQGTPPEQIGPNFVLVITTGRGRMAWWDKVKNNPAYARFTTFRPIESILGAVEDALQMPDDIDLKYNLTKLFLGS